MDGFPGKESSKAEHGCLTQQDPRPRWLGLKWWHTGPTTALETTKSPPGTQGPKSLSVQ